MSVYADTFLLYFIELTTCTRLPAILVILLYNEYCRLMPISISTLFAQRSVSNASHVTIQLLRSLKIPVTQTAIIDTVEGHPDHPSLVSISDALNKWKVNNAALQVDKGRVDELPCRL